MGAVAAAAVLTSLNKNVGGVAGEVLGELAKGVCVESIAGRSDA